MKKGIELQVNTRNGSVGEIRRKGDIPAVLYGYGLEPVSLQVESRQFVKALQAAGTTSLITLQLDGEARPAIIRDVQLHPLRENVIHVDFYQVRMDIEVQADVPLVFVGEAPAVKDLGGVLVRSLDELDVSALPNDLPHNIEVDISSLDDFEKIIRVADLKLPPGVSVSHEDDEVIALVQAPRTQEELDQLSEEVSENVEGVEGVKKEESAEGEEAADKEAAPEDTKK